MTYRKIQKKISIFIFNKYIMPTKITNENIHNLVGKYIYDKNSLPKDLKDILIGDWDVSRVNYMSELFYKMDFNEDINNWNVSNVIKMDNMFNSSTFNQPLYKWNVSKVETMEGMFFLNTIFNEDLSSWDVSNVKNMSNMFGNCVEFNRDLSSWYVYNVKTMESMFFNCEKLEINPNWILNKKTNTKDMFAYTPLENVVLKRASYNVKKANKDVRNTNALYRNIRKLPIDTLKLVLDYHDPYELTKTRKSMKNDEYLKDFILPTSRKEINETRHTGKGRGRTKKNK